MLSTLWLKYTFIDVINLIRIKQYQANVTLT